MVSGGMSMSSRPSSTCNRQPKWFLKLKDHTIVNTFAITSKVPMKVFPVPKTNH